MAHARQHTLVHALSETEWAPWAGGAATPCAPDSRVGADAVARALDVIRAGREFLAPKAKTSEEILAEMQAAPKRKLQAMLVEHWKVTTAVVTVGALLAGGQSAYEYGKKGYEEASGFLQTVSQAYDAARQARGGGADAPALPVGGNTTPGVTPRLVLPQAAAGPTPTVVAGDGPRPPSAPKVAVARTLFEQLAPGCSPARIDEALKKVPPERMDDPAAVIEALGSLRGVCYSVRPDGAVSGVFGADADPVEVTRRVLEVIREINPHARFDLVQGLYAPTAEGTEEVVGSWNLAANLLSLSVDFDRSSADAVLETAFHEGMHSVEPLLSEADVSILLKAFPGDAPIEAWMQAFPREAIDLMQRLAPGAVPHSDAARLALISDAYSDWQAGRARSPHPRALESLQAIERTVEAMTVKSIKTDDWPIVAGAGTVGRSHEEKTARAFARWAMQRERLRNEVEGPFRRAMGMLRRLRDRLLPRRADPVADVFARIRSGAIAGRGADRVPEVDPDQECGRFLTEGGTPEGWRRITMVLSTTEGPLEVNAYTAPGTGLAIHYSTHGVGWDVSHLGTGLKLNPERPPFLTSRHAADFLEGVRSVCDWERATFRTLKRGAGLIDRLAERIGATLGAMDERYNAGRGEALPQEQDRVAAVLSGPDRGARRNPLLAGRIEAGKILQIHGGDADGVGRPEPLLVVGVRPVEGGGMVMELAPRRLDAPGTGAFLVNVLTDVGRAQAGLAEPVCFDLRHSVLVGVGPGGFEPGVDGFVSGELTPANRRRLQEHAAATADRAVPRVARPGTWMPDGPAAVADAGRVSCRALALPLDGWAVGPEAIDAVARMDEVGLLRLIEGTAARQMEMHERAQREPTARVHHDEMALARALLEAEADTRRGRTIAGRRLEMLSDEGRAFALRHLTGVPVQAPAQIDASAGARVTPEPASRRMPRAVRAAREER